MVSEQLLQNTLEQVRRLVGSHFAFYTATSLTIMNEMNPIPPAVCFNQETNLYYFRHRGNFAGTLDPEYAGQENPTYRGVLQQRDSDSWVPLELDQWLYKVRNKTELDQLIVNPPALAYREDTSRYYYRIGPEGYGGRTGRNQRRDGQGNPMWTGSEHITRTVVVPGPNTWNTLYTAISSPVVVAGSMFTVDGIVDLNTGNPIVFQITRMESGTWTYTPEHNSVEMVGHQISTQTVPIITGQVLAPPTPPNTNECYVSGSTGTVLVGHTFTVAGRSTIFTITDIDGSKWTYSPTEQQFANGTLITMTHAGNPVMEERDPNAWILNSHLYEDNTQGVI